MNITNDTSVTVTGLAGAIVAVAVCVLAEVGITLDVQTVAAVGALFTVVLGLAVPTRTS